MTTAARPGPRLQFRQGFDWRRVAWSRPGDPVSFTCSYCWRAIDEREAPLRLMGQRYAVFCDQCVAEWIERAP